MFWPSSIMLTIVSYLKDFGNVLKSVYKNVITEEILNFFPAIGGKPVRFLTLTEPSQAPRVPAALTESVRAHTPSFASTLYPIPLKHA